VPPGLENVAFLTPEGKKVLILLREAPGNSSFAIKYKGQLATVNLQGGSVTTFVWD
jgi:glucosylceramidase